ncbi:MAG: hypothetical protein ABSA83_01820 [Verrucomicrobiota bacterium]|jgi:type II secretory pathway pseudopilin PulG
MKKMMPPVGNFEQAFTRAELLIVIPLVAILVVILIPSGGPSKATIKKEIAKSEEYNLVAAIEQYCAVYCHLPVSSNAVAAAGTNDFTFGTMSKTPEASGQISTVKVGTPGENAYQDYNSEVIAILRDDNFWPEANKGAQHIYNSQHMVWTVERSCSLFQFKDFSVAAAGGADFGCEEFLEGNAFG